MQEMGMGLSCTVHGPNRGKLNAGGVVARPQIQRGMGHSIGPQPKLKGKEAIMGLGLSYRPQPLGPILNKPADGLV